MRRAADFTPVRRPATAPTIAPVSPVRSDQGDTMEKLLTIDEAAVLLGTTPRFPRRLIAERRIRFVRLGRHVRIPESALIDYVTASTVEASRPAVRQYVPRVA